MIRGILSLFALLSISFIACKAKPQAELELPLFTKDTINSQALWLRITEKTNFRTYPMWPDHRGLQLGMSPHGRYHKVYINQILLNSVPNSQKKAPYGSICIKENYTASKDVTGYTVMTKIKDYSPQYGDWYWAKYDQQGNVQAEGQIMPCINCHIGSNNDFITIRKLDKPLNWKNNK